MISKGAAQLHFKLGCFALNLVQEQAACKGAQGGRAHLQMGTKGRGRSRVAWGTRPSPEDPQGNINFQPVLKFRQNQSESNANRQMR